MKIIYMGSPEFALPTLVKIKQSHHELLCCYSQPPRARNRGKKVVNTIIHDYCLAHNIECLTPINFKNPADVEVLRNFKPDLLVVCAYGLILPEALLNIPKYGAINIHPSKLPRWRGAAPIQRAIMAGDKETSVCIIKMTKELDQGDIILEQNLVIDKDMTASKLHDITAEIGAELTLKAIELIAAEEHEAVPQAQEGVTYAAKIQKSESIIDFNKSGEEIINLIRGLADYPAAYMEFRGKRLKIFSAEFIKSSSQDEPGTVTFAKDILTITCSDGLIKPLVIQIEGKQKMLVIEFLKGFTKSQL